MRTAVTLENQIDYVTDRQREGERVSERETLFRKIQSQFGGREREGECVRGFSRSYSGCVFLDVGYPGAEGDH